MRFLFFTDTHVRGINPQNRKDIFLESLLRKLEEVVELAAQKEVDYVLHGGDFFDLPNPSLSVVGDFLSVFNRFRVPVYGVAGNHDLYGHNLTTLPRTMLGFMHRLELVHLLEREPVFLQKDGLKIQLTGQSYHYDMDRRDPRADYCTAKDREAHLALHVVHGMLLDRAMPAGVAHTMVERVQETEAELTLVGHNHLGMEPVEFAGKYIINPGSLVRISNHEAELRRRPRVLLLDLEGGRVSLDFLSLRSARSGEEVLERSQMEALNWRRQKLEDFISGVRAVEKGKHLTLQDIVEEVSRREGLEPRVREETLSRISRAEERLQTGEELENAPER